MTQKETIPLTKLISFIAFICAALMASLFIYHNQQKSAAVQISGENGTIFTAPRDIKTFDLITAKQEKFTPKDLLNHWTLLFFGFTHCTNVCPATLEMLQHAYQQLHPSYPSLQVVFVSLDPERDTPAHLAKYLTAFHPDFLGVTGKIQDIRKLQSQLGIFSVRDESSGNDYQLQHTSSILLINPQGKWTALFKFGMNPETFVSAFKESMHSLS